MAGLGRGFDSITVDEDGVLVVQGQSMTDGELPSPEEVIDVAVCLGDGKTILVGRVDEPQLDPWRVEGGWQAAHNGGERLDEIPTLAPGTEVKLVGVSTGHPDAPLDPFIWTSHCTVTAA